MKNSRQLLWMFGTLGLSFLVIQSYYSIVGSSNAQQQNETTNQIQMQSQENISETKFLKNSTSFGNATANLKIKHAPEFSTLTIQPWPIVEPSREFNITGILSTTSAPDIQGIVFVTAVYNGSGLYHSVASDPALVISFV